MAQCPRSTLSSPSIDQTLARNAFLTPIAGNGPNGSARQTKSRKGRGNVRSASTIGIYFYDPLRSLNRPHLLLGAHTHPPSSSRIGKKRFRNGQTASGPPGKQSYRTLRRNRGGSINIYWMFPDCAFVETCWDAAAFSEEALR